MFAQPGDQPPPMYVVRSAGIGSTHPEPALAANGGELIFEAGPAFVGLFS